nr:arginase family protein [Pedobacter sp. ASV2]
MVFPIIEKIVAAGKVPIVIGGGHNNAYPIIKGSSLACLLYTSDAADDTT